MVKYQPQFVYFLTEHLTIIRPDKDFGLSKNLWKFIILFQNFEKIHIVIKS